MSLSVILRENTSWFHILAIQSSFTELENGVNVPKSLLERNTSWLELFVVEARADASAEDARRSLLVVRECVKSCQVGKVLCTCLDDLGRLASSLQCGSAHVEERRRLEDCAELVPLLVLQEWSHARQLLTRRLELVDWERRGLLRSLKCSVSSLGSLFPLDAGKGGRNLSADGGGADGPHKGPPRRSTAVQRESGCAAAEREYEKAERH